MVYGRFDAKRMALNGMKIIGTNPDDPMAPIYPANANIRQTTIRQLIVAAWEQYQTAIEAIIPPAIVAHYHLMDRRQMIHDMHFPADSDAASQARRSAKFEEFFFYFRFGCRH